jgi:hypothetical protein
MASARRLAVLFLLLLACPAAADITIAPSCRVKNRPPGRCGWCALETLARHHHIEAMYGFTDRHPCTCSADSLEESLLRTGVRYRIQYSGCTSQEILKFAMRRGLGAAVGLLDGGAAGEGHMVTLVGFSAHAVKIIDPNDADGRTRRLSLNQFLSCWDGLAVVLLPTVRWTRTPAAARTLCRRPPEAASTFRFVMQSAAFPVSPTRQRGRAHAPISLAGASG